MNGENMNGENTLVVTDLVKRYGNFEAVKGVSFALKRGEFVGFIGPNGAGKTTTMRSIAGLLLADGGSIHVDGHPAGVDDTSLKARASVGFVPQDLDLYKYLTGEELLRFVAGIRGVPDEVAEPRIQELLALCELGKMKGRLVREYSGGMQRKLSIAAAILARPPLLLLDESFVGIDPESTYRIRAYLKQYTAEGGTVLLSSHILDMVERIADRVIVLHGGQVVRDLAGDALAEAIANEGDLTRLYLGATDNAALLEADV